MNRPGAVALRADRCFWQALAVLVVFNVARGLGLLGPPAVSAVVLVAAVLLIARLEDATLADLGLRRADVGRGLRYGLSASGIVVVALVIAASIPAVNSFFDDSRADISGGELAYAVGVSTVLLTAIPEEIAFRGVLLGSARQLWGPWRASFVTSALFGLWHISPTLDTMRDNSAVDDAATSAVGQVVLVIGAVSVTFAAGLVFCWLRLRSRSLVAPLLAHAASNGFALVGAWFAVN